MFHTARIKLTLWYLLIIMCISVAFSMVIFRMLSFELDRVERTQKMRSERFAPERISVVVEGKNNFPPNDFPQIIQLDPDVIKEVKNRILITLTIINAGILGASTILGYFLAGKTLHPIKQMMDEQNQFITDASHELRTPITSLKASIEVGLREKKLTQTHTRQLLKSTLEDINALQTLSDGLIKLNQYQKIDTIPLHPVDLQDVVDKAIKKVQHQATYRHITIQKSIIPVSFAGDMHALVELVTIFLDNAIKYSPEHTTIHLQGAKKNTMLTLTVKDHGIGIDKKDIPHIFNRFYRTDRSRTKTDTPGYGLGLAIAKHIVDRHHGSIDVESIKGKGTTFFVSLPIKEA